MVGSQRGPIGWRELALKHGFASVRELDRTRTTFTIPVAEQPGLHTAAGELDELTASALADVLAGHTTTPDGFFVAVWDGWRDVPVQRFSGAAPRDRGAATSCCGDH